MKKTLSWLLLLMSCDRLQAQVTDSLRQDHNRADSVKTSVLKEVSVTGKRPAIQLLPDRTIINVESSVTNTGATILEVLEKSPGVTMDKNGEISLKGRKGVLIMIDGKPAQVTGTSLNNLLGGMTAAQVDQIEIIDNPSARYDAAGNAGIINIKTKKLRQKGFNGNFSLSFTHGRYARTVNSITLNRYQGKVNLFATVSLNINKNFSDLYALRTYYKSDNQTVSSFLQQPTYFTGHGPSYSIKTGIDFFADSKTTIGAVLTVTGFDRITTGNNEAIWMNPSGIKDSTITTIADNRDKLHNAGVNINAKHSFGEGKELTADLDYLGYSPLSEQYFTNRLQGAGGYLETLSGNIPSTIHIFTGKADYSQSFKKGSKMDAGWKSSHVKTDNTANYFYDYGSGLQADLGKTNHFLYEENIHALYLNGEKRFDKLNVQAGLRYENTRYRAEQLGNAARKDSSFSRNYDGFFPTATLSLPLDSNNTISLTAGRRIDRPPFHSLNPFVFVINKYTYETGNPFYRPQYTWNTEFSYSFKNMFVASLSYSITKDYFSQIFFTDTSGIFYYSEGNLDRMTNLGLSVSTQLALADWWSLSGQVAVNYKKIRGFVGMERMASLTQLNLNINNQFNFSKGWSGELSGFFTTREQELQEITDPTGQVSAGVARQLFRNRGTLKFLVRDIFYTQAMKGNTTFAQATEYFKITRDTRAATLSFSFRFGTTAKNSSRKTGGADEEMRRVNSAR